MIACAFFPALPNTLPIIRSIIREKKNYSLTTLLSFPGFGLGDRDAGFLDLRDSVGLTIQTELSADNNNWECLLVADHQDDMNKEYNDSYTLQMMISAMCLHKDVKCAKRLSSSECNTCISIAKINNCNFTYLPHEEETRYKTIGPLERLHSFYILFGSITYDAQSLDACLNCFEELSKVYRAVSLSTDENPLLCGVKSLFPIIHATFSETEKVYGMNQFFANIERTSHPELIFIHTKEPVLAFDDVVPNGFGLVPYMLSKAIPTNLFICSLPYLYCNPVFADNLNNGCMNQNGYPIDGIIASNMLIDASGISERERVSATYVPGKIVERQLSAYQQLEEEQIPTYNVISKSGIEQLVSDIAEVFREYSSIRVIP